MKTQRRIQDVAPWLLCGAVLVNALQLAWNIIHFTPDHLLDPLRVIFIIGALAFLVWRY